MCLIQPIHADNFNEKDVTYLLTKLKGYDDEYTKKLVSIFEEYLEHKDFERLHEDLFKTDHLREIPFHLDWDINTRMGYLEVIYPA